VNPKVDVRKRGNKDLEQRTEAYKTGEDSSENKRRKSFNVCSNWQMTQQQGLGMFATLMMTMAMNLVAISTTPDTGKQERWPDFNSGEIVAPRWFKSRVT